MRALFLLPSLRGDQAFLSRVGRSMAVVHLLLGSIVIGVSSDWLLAALIWGGHGLLLFGWHQAQRREASAGSLIWTEWIGVGIHFGYVSAFQLVFSEVGLLWAMHFSFFLRVVSFYSDRRSRVLMGVVVLVATVGCEFWNQSELEPILLAGTVLSTVVLMMSLLAEVFLSRVEGMKINNAYFYRARDMFYQISPDGVILDCNDAAVKKLGKPKEQLIGIRLFEMYGEMSRWKAEGMFNRAKKQGQMDIEDMEMNVLMANGETLPVLLSSTEIRNESGELLSTICIHKDLSDTKLSQRIIADQQAQLAHAAKFSALGEMSGGIAHEINNPLAIISGYAQRLGRLAGRGEMDSKQLIHLSQKIEATSDRIARIVKSLRMISRETESDVLEEVTVRSIFDDTLGLCQERFRLGGVDLRVDQFPDDLKLKCSPVEVSQVLLNLLNNAFDAIENRESPWVRIQVRCNDDFRQGFLEISVTDSGEGIPETVREKMLNPFFTTKEVGKGTGLGLSISTGLIAKHGGELFLDQTCLNTRFVIRLPLEQEQAAVA